MGSTDLPGAARDGDTSSQAKVGEPPPRDTEARRRGHEMAGEERNPRGRVTEQERGQREVPERQAKGREEEAAGQKGAWPRGGVPGRN